MRSAPDRAAPSGGYLLMQVLFDTVRGCTLTPYKKDVDGVNVYDVLLFVFLQLYAKSQHHLHHNSNEVRAITVLDALALYAEL